MKQATRTKQVIGLILIIVCSLIVWDVFLVPDKSDLFFELWTDDIRLLQKNKSLPTELKNIKTVSVQPLNQKARDLLDRRGSPFKINPKGNLTLEILMDVWQEEKEIEEIEVEEIEDIAEREDIEQEGVYIQYNLMSDDGNTIWELSRTILLPKSSSLTSSWFPQLFEKSSDDAAQEDLMED